MSAERVIKGAAAFGVALKLGEDDALSYDAAFEPSESILARIREHEAAIWTSPGTRLYDTLSSPSLKGFKRR